MPTPGPVAYQAQSFFFVDAVISTGLDQVAPSSVLLQIQTVRAPRAVPILISPSLSSPRFFVRGSQIVPDSRSTTGQGFPNVLGPSAATI